MNAEDHKLIQLIELIYLNNLCCPMPVRWAGLSNRVCSEEILSRSPERYPTSLILGGWWESSDTEKRSRLLEQILFAYRHGTLDEGYEYLMSLGDDEWHKMSQ